MKVTRIYLDLDGVMADFKHSACRLFGIKENKENLEIGLENLVGGEAFFWKKIHSQGEGFWSGMPLLPWAHDLFKLCKKFADVVEFLTSPANNAACFAGKYEWCRKHFGQLPIICKPKYLLARADALLIDDSPKKLDKFIEHGGAGILWPMKIHMTNQRLKKLFKQIETYCKE